MAKKKIKKEEDVNSSPFLPTNEMDQLNDDIEFYSSRLKKENVKMNCAAIIGLLGEYLDDFVVLGHDPNGWDFIVRKADNPKDLRALTSLVEDYADGKVKMSPGVKKMPSPDTIEDFMKRMNEIESEDDESYLEEDDDDQIGDF